MRDRKELGRIMATFSMVTQKRKADINQEKQNTCRSKAVKTEPSFKYYT